MMNRRNTVVLQWRLREGKRGNPLTWWSVLSGLTWHSSSCVCMCFLRREWKTWLVPLPLGKVGLCNSSVIRLKAWFQSTAPTSERPNMNLDVTRSTEGVVAMTNRDTLLLFSIWCWTSWQVSVLKSLQEVSGVAFHTFFDSIRFWSSL